MYVHLEKVAPQFSQNGGFLQVILSQKPHMNNGRYVAKATHEQWKICYKSHTRTVEDMLQKPHMNKGRYVTKATHNKWNICYKRDIWTVEDTLQKPHMNNERYVTKRIEPNPNQRVYFFKFVQLWQLSRQVCGWNRIRNTKDKNRFYEMRRG